VSVPGTAALTVADDAVGVVLLCAGAVAWRRRPANRTGLLLVATGLCWFAGSLAGPAVLLHRGPLVHLQMAYPSGRLRRPLAIAVVGLGYGLCGLVGVGRDPWVSLGFAVLLCAAALDVYGHSSGPARKAGGISLAAALGIAAVLALGGVRRLLDRGGDLPVLMAYDGVVTLGALALVLGLARGGWTDAALADLVTDLGDRRDTDGLAGRLRRALGDASLSVGFWDADSGRYLDESGHPVSVPTADTRRSVTRVDDHGVPLAVLVHDSVLLDDPRLVSGVGSAARLAVSNARMRAEVRQRVTELAESRRRLVDAADAQSRRLGGELEDGAERRLERVSDLIDQAELASGCGTLLPGVRTELDSARQELREFAQGIRPTALGAGGLPAAVPLLAARAPVPVDVLIAVGRLAPTVEAALFFFCSEALANVAKHARATRAGIDLRVDHDAVVAAVIDDGAGGADARGTGLRGLTDRIEALGGTMTVSTLPGGGTRLVATIGLDGPLNQRGST
jgi:hypothetical protein